MMADWLGAGVSYMPQGPGDLGERMTRAMTEAFDAGAGEVVIIGSDCPLLSGDTLREAFQALGRSDMVIGPASDGGYYLVGLHSSARYRALPHVFFGPAWGTETVRSTTLSLAEQRQLSVHCLAELRDVDRPEDIPLWQNIREKCRKRRESPRISVIIPAMDEADYIGATLRAVKSACDIEILVADGGSSDATATIAEAVGARVLPYKPGRARQANAAAQLACGQVLLFLHADTRVPLGWDQIIEEAMADPGTIAGVFSFGVDIGGFSMRLFTKVANFRARWLHRPYGDQGLFLRKSTFEQLGGFPDIPIMDDLEIVRRLARLGRIVVVPTPAITSGRRWRRYGIWRTMWVNQICVIAYLLGVSPYRIARWYNRRPDRYDDYG
jgi:rSAM/selenodomain-associated transferase 2/rSAM/selenodomain-associated transferase 1